MKRVISLFLTLIMVVGVLTNLVMFVTAASFTDINANSVFIKQQPNTSTCTLCAATNMMRRLSMLRGDSNWSSITESSARSSAWISGTGLRGTFNYSDSSNGIANISVTCKTLPGNSSNTSTLINLLASHPEGIVIYNGIHAVLLTDYTGGVFYCNDPDDEQPVGRVPASRAYSVKPENATKYWYVSSPSVTLNNYTEPPAAPKNVRTSTGTNLFTTSDYITFYWDPSFSATDYWIYMWKDGEQIYATDMGNNTSFTAAPSSVGKYTLIVRAGNSYGYSNDPAAVDFIVYDSAPKAPEKVWGEKTSFSSEEYFTISWSTVDIATEYWVYMWKDGVQIYQTNIGNSTSFTSAPTSPGQYTLIVRAGNACGYSNDPCSFDFTVYDANATYTITYNANGGTGAPASQTKTYGQTLTLSSTKPTRSGYTFLGWSTSSSATKATYSAGGSFNTDANTTLYAVWSKNHSHSYTGTVTKAPTCTQTGIRTYKCSCGVSYTQAISATGHTASNWITDKKATVNAAGSQHKECTVCGEVLETAVIPQLKPSDPTLSKAANANGGVTVTWKAVSGADSYRVYRKTSSSGWTCLNSKVTSTSYTDKSTKSGTTYYYTVRAENEAGLSGYNKTGVSVKYLAMPKVSSLSNTNSGITIKWNKTTGASGYYVYRQTGSGSWSLIYTVKSGSTVSYTDKSAKAGTTYYYTVRAYNGSVKSTFTSSTAIRRLTTPTLKSVSSAKSGITFKWNKVTGASGYYVYRKTGSGGWQKIATVKSGSTVSYLDKSAKKGTTYTYTVKAYYSSNVSAYNTTGLKIKDKY